MKDSLIHHSETFIINDLTYCYAHEIPSLIANQLHPYLHLKGDEMIVTKLFLEPRVKRVASEHDVGYFDGFDAHPFIASEIYKANWNEWSELPHLQLPVAEEKIHEYIDTFNSAHQGSKYKLAYESISQKGCNAAKNLLAYREWKKIIEGALFIGELGCYREFPHIIINNGWLSKVPPSSDDPIRIRRDRVLVVFISELNNYLQQYQIQLFKNAI